MLLPAPIGPVEVDRHWTAARRVRVRVPGLVGQPRVAARVEDLLSSLPGIAAVEASTASGRVLLAYEPGARLLDELSAGAAREARRPSSPRVRDALRHPLRQLRAGLGRLTAPAAAAPVEAPWHAITVGEALRRIGSGPGGVTEQDAAQRLARFGANAIDDVAPRSRVAILASQVSNLPTALLLGSSAVSLLLGDAFDAVAILAVVSLNSAIGYVVERQNEKLLASWRSLEAGAAHVVRDGMLRTIPGDALVPGDVVALRAGDVVPADARVLSSNGLACGEAALTGESEPRDKSSLSVGDDAPLAERSSMVWAGTVVVSGDGRALVVRTGPNTEIGAVRRLVDATRTPPTPLATRLSRLGNRVALASVGAAAAVGAVGLARRWPIGDVVRGAVALGVAAIPEGLPVVSTTALARSMERMRRSGLVVRRLQAAETLGGVQVLAADKTGTLTRNSMELAVVDLGRRRVDPVTVRAARDPMADPASRALAIGVLNSSVHVQRRDGALDLFGSATERALVTAADRAGIAVQSLRARYPRRWLRERSNGVHYVVTQHATPDGATLELVKGAPEQVLALCARDASGPLDARRRRALLRRNAAMAADGLRVLALAWRRVVRGEPAPAPDEADAPRDLAFAGLVGLRDPLRTGAGPTVRHAARAGIRTLILTGDQRRTAEAVGRELGLGGDAIDGAELVRRVDRGEDLGGVAVVSRVTPADKLAMIQALRRSGRIVAMAGDGVNDAPALKSADIGIAIGADATDIARQVADAVLVSEDLRSLVEAVREGRVVQDNLRRSIRFLFATNLSEMALATAGAFAGVRDVLTPLQLLWINLLTDTLPALALALDEGRASVLDRPPAPPDAPLVDDPRRVVRDGALIAAAAAATGILFGRAAAFQALTGTQLAYAITCRQAGATGGGRFGRLVGGAAALQASTLLPGALRGALGLPAAVGAAEVAALAAGIVIPMAARLGARGVIVRRGRPAARSTHEGGSDAVPSPVVHAGVRRRGDQRPRGQEAPAVRARGGDGGVRDRGRRRGARRDEARGPRGPAGRGA